MKQQRAKDHRLNRVVFIYEIQNYVAALSGQFCSASISSLSIVLTERYCRFVLTTYFDVFVLVNYNRALFSTTGVDEIPYIIVVFFYLYIYIFRKLQILIHSAFSFFVVLSKLNVIAYYTFQR